ncbi:DUF3313 domain-containing protein [Massilia timonae]|uniref:Lipoprotein n=1 Tax=Massilia timonae TaxID=47229 RepID=A0A1S2NAW6_9BURK|nr:DUF3313 domain-containing protein [Massilia timonae]OIJ42236.1 hypothetical protein LO55_3738 [Massilia timonae]
MKTSIGTVLVAIALAGCQSSQTTEPGEVGTAQAQRSGFLGDYSQLKPAPDRDGVELYVDRSVDYTRYTKLLLDPIQVLAAPAPGQPPPAPDAIARMSADFQQSLQRALAPAYQVVTTPGPDVLRVRIAITNVQAVKPPTGASDFIPIKALYNAGRAVAGTSPRLVEMTAEMEALAPDGRRVIAATATRRGDKTLPQGEQITWTELQSISDYWAGSFRRRLDEVRSPAAAGVSADE